MSFEKLVVPVLVCYRMCQPVLFTPQKQLEKPTHCVVYVAKSYPEWQRITLEVIIRMYEDGGKKAIPENKEIATALKGIPALKKFMKKVGKPCAFREMKTLTSYARFRLCLS